MAIEIIPLASFSLRSICPTKTKSGGTQKVFRSKAAAELHLGHLPSVSNILAVPVLSLTLHGDTLTAQAAFAKIDIRCETCQWYFIIYSSGWRTLDSKSISKIPAC